MKSSKTRGQRLPVMLVPDELAALEDFRFKQRMPTRAAAIRELLKRGLAAEGFTSASLTKSGTSVSRARLQTVGRSSGDVGFGSKADICAAISHVRFTPKADMCGALTITRRKRLSYRELSPYKRHELLTGEILYQVATTATATAVVRT